jgi:subtilase family serine protease
VVLLAVIPLVTLGSIAGAITSAPASAGAIRDGPAATQLVPRGAARTGVVAGDQKIELRVTMAPRNPLAVTAELSSLNDRSSSNFHHWLAPGQFDRQYGPSGAEIAATVAWLHSRQVTDTRVDGLAIDAVASARTAAAAFGLTLQTYRSRSGQTGFAPSSAPLVPAGLAQTTVRSIIGLDSFDVPTAQGSGVGAATGSCSTANELSNADTFIYPQIAQDYGINSLVAGGQDGAGETVALYELEGHDAGVADYDSCFGLSPTITTRAVDDGGPQQAGGDSEADVDIEAVANDAPAAAIESYEGPNTDIGAYDTWAAIVTDDNAQVVSSSWDVCEASSGMAPYDMLLEQAATQGQSVFVASGDWGAEGCLPYDSIDTTPAVEYPASSPDVVAVGGTTLNADGAEVAWNDCEGVVASGCTFGAGGGGVSTTEKALDAQKVVTGSAAREVPDISANAGTGMVVDVDGGWGSYVGTSLATPMMASLIADRNDGCAGKTGLFTPDLYADASSIYGTGLDDVTTGDNDLTGTNGGAYAAGVGYDMATGLGTPLAAGLTCADVDAASSTSAVAGTRITLAGLGLERSTVDFGAVAAAVVASTAISATVTVPAGAGTVNISATSTLGAGSHTVAFTYPTSVPSTPGAPEAPTAVARDASAMVNVTDSSGGAPVSYEITARDSTTPAHGGQTATVEGASGSASVTGLTNGDTYRFTATATNGTGTSASSVASNAVTPVHPAIVMPVPPRPPPLPLGIPLAPRATGGNADAKVSVSDPAVADVTAPATSFTVTAIDLGDASRGHQTCTVEGPDGSCTVTGLSNGDRYEFVSVARGADHVSPTSVASNVVVPRSNRTTLRVSISGGDPTAADRMKVETVTIRNIGAEAATGLTVALTKAEVMAVRFAPGWSVRGQLLSRRLAQLEAGKAVTYRVTLYLRFKPSGARYISVVAAASNASQVKARHRFG